MEISNHLKNVLRSAIGRWDIILKASGMEPHFLQNKHGPCPICGGKDRFRYDDIDGRGTFFCNQCGAGDGFELYKRFTGYSTVQALRALEEYLWGRGANLRQPTHVNTHLTKIAEKALSSRAAEIENKISYILSRAIPASPTHPYLVLKKIPGTGLRQYKDALIIEMYAGAYELVSFQFINPDKKRFLKGAAKKGTYSIVGKYNSHDPIIIAEGFATAMSIHMSTGFPVFIGFDCHNLEHALATILLHHDNHGEVILAADNDEDGKGLDCAKKAVTNLKLRNAHIIMPTRVDYDWNDIYCEDGPEAVRAAFSEVLA